MFNSDSDSDSDQDSSHPNDSAEDDDEDQFMYPGMRLGHGHNKPGFTFASPPFWFAREDENHAAVIVAKYEAHFEVNVEFRSPQRDARRLPTFIGRIHREPTREDPDVHPSEHDFHTLDRVEIYRRDVRAMGGKMTLIETKHTVTRWDADDGVPTSWRDIPPNEVRFSSPFPLSCLSWKSASGYGMWHMTPRASIACQVR